MNYACRYPAAARTLYEALAEDDFYRTLAAAASDDPEAAQEAMIRYLDYSMIEAEEYGQLVLPADPSSGAAIWNKPLDPAILQTLSAQKKAFIAEHMGERCCQVYTAMTGFMHQHTMTVVDAGSWYLSIIGISPELQGRGIGRELMRAVLEQTDRAGIATFLETFTPASESFYQRHGYVTRARFLEPETRARYAVMQREPARGARRIRPAG
ncbi:MAG TPA: GNAT family N-acetyltransferase [Woeseiaceae bacterium]|nr:GNAT family N-acetyltransferase [Woeseiaceae bacterium]